MEYKYKNSGVEWIGKIPEHWGLDRIKDVSSLRDEKINIKSDEKNYLELEDIEQGTGNIISFRNTTEVRSAVMRFKKRDVLFGKLRPYLEKYYYATKDGYCTGEILAISPIKVDGRFFKYFISSPNFINRCNVIAYGAKMPRVNWSKQIAIFEISLPPLPEQQAIAVYLDKACTRIDRIIEIKEKQLEQIEELRKSEIYRCCTKGINPNVSLKKTKRSYIKEIPKHWKIEKLKRGCEKIDTGGTPKSDNSENFLNGTIKWFAPDCFNSLVLNHPKKMINEIAVKNNEIKIYPKNSIFFVGVGATAGKVSIIEEPASCNQQINILQTNHKLLPKFLVYHLKVIEKEIIKFAQYTTLPILNQSKTGYIDISFPPMKEQKDIVKYLDNFQLNSSKLEIKLKSQIKTLKNYRKSLIHECVTGKKQVYFDELNVTENVYAGE